MTTQLNLKLPEETFLIQILSFKDMFRFRGLAAAAAAAAAAGSPFGAHAAGLDAAAAQFRGLPGLGDVYSCMKCEKIFSTPHGLEVHARY